MGTCECTGCCNITKTMDSKSFVFGNFHLKKWLLLFETLTLFTFIWKKGRKYVFSTYRLFEEHVLKVNFNFPTCEVKSRESFPLSKTPQSLLYSYLRRSIILFFLPLPHSLHLFSISRLVYATLNWCLFITCSGSVVYNFWMVVFFRKECLGDMNEL